MQTIIFWLLVAIALLVCAIAGLIIYISGLQAKLKASYASNKELYKSYKDVREASVDIRKELNNKNDLLEETKKDLDYYRKMYEQVYDLFQKLKKDYKRLELKRITKALVKKPTTADYKKAIIKDYKAGADVHDIATKYNFKANTVFKAIARRKAKGDIK